MKAALLAQKYGSLAKKIYECQEKLAQSYDFRLLAVLKVVNNKGTLDGVMGELSSSILD